MVGLCTLISDAGRVDDSPGLCLWGMVGASLGVAHRSDESNGHRTVHSGSGWPGVTMGSIADHILVGVVVACTGPGLSHFFSA